MKSFRVRYRCVKKHNVVKWSMDWNILHFMFKNHMTRCTVVITALLVRDKSLEAPASVKRVYSYWSREPIMKWVTWQSQSIFRPTNDKNGDTSQVEAMSYIPLTVNLIATRLGLCGRLTTVRPFWIISDRLTISKSSVVRKNEEFMNKLTFRLVWVWNSKFHMCYKHV